MSWMTGWALCGHKGAADEGDKAVDGGGGRQVPAADYVQSDDDDDSGDEAVGGEDGEETCTKGRKERSEGEGETGPGAATGGPIPKRRRVSARTPEGDEEATAPNVCGSAAQHSIADLCPASQAPVAECAQDTPAPVAVQPALQYPAELPRERRMAVGMQCKALIDRGRLEWLKGRCPLAEWVSYCSPEVSGECKLLLAVSGRNRLLEET